VTVRAQQFDKVIKGFPRNLLLSHRSAPVFEVLVILIIRDTDSNLATAVDASENLIRLSCATNEARPSGQQ
jgi:hypothetical protein